MPGARDRWPTCGSTETTKLSWQHHEKRGRNIRAQCSPLAYTTEAYLYALPRCWVGLNELLGGNPALCLCGLWARVKRAMYRLGAQVDESAERFGAQWDDYAVRSRMAAKEER